MTYTKLIAPIKLNILAKNEEEKNFYTLPWLYYGFLFCAQLCYGTYLKTIIFLMVLLGTQQPNQGVRDSILRKSAVLLDFVQMRGL